MGIAVKELILHLGQPMVCPFLSTLRRTYPAKAAQFPEIGQAHLVFPAIGIDVALVTAEQLLPATVAPDRKALHVKAFLLYAQGVEGFQAYPGELPVGLKWGDGMVAAKKAMVREPNKIGGGGEFSKALNKMVPLFLLYEMSGGFNLHLQFSDFAKLEMLTVDLKPLI